MLPPSGFVFFGKIAEALFSAPVFRMQRKQ
ncbi:Uncharacterised protein [uncultured archaeon]|nr:Uncharacterised protein [uncultured archaeon]